MTFYGIPGSLSNNRSDFFELKILKSGVFRIKISMFER